MMLTVLSRLGAGSRVVLTHDVAQRDNLRVGRHDGVAAVIEKLKGHPLFGRQRARCLHGKVEVAVRPLPTCGHRAEDDRQLELGVLAEHRSEHADGIRKLSKRKRS